MGDAIIEHSTQPKNVNLNDDFKTNPEISNQNLSELTSLILDDGTQIEENKSILTMKKIYSIERIAFSLSSTKTEDLKGSEIKVNRGSKLLRTSSTNLEKEQNLNELKKYSKSSFAVDYSPERSANELFQIDILNMKRYALSNYIKDNAKAADLKWSLFCAACHSYRYDSVLRPFPPMFLDEDVKDIDKLRDVAESCPSINVLYNQIQERTCKVAPDLINLLYWVLIHSREPQLKFIPKDKHQSILSKVTSTTNSIRPHYIFQVMYNVKHTEQQKFNELARNYKTIHGFHGSRLDNFYSILNYGLRISFSKMSPFGHGIFLSSEMYVSLPYSQTGFSWGGSYFGGQISVVALCEMIDHPDVKYPDYAKTQKKKHFISHSEAVPEKYFIVQNSDLIRVKYLLIYCNSLPERLCNSQISTAVSWFQRNKVIAVVVAYVFLLMAIATSNNSALYGYYKKIVKKVGSKFFRV